MRQLIDEVKAVPLAQGFDEVFYPGEVEDRAEAANLAAGGVVLAEQSLADLADAGRRDRRAVPRERPVMRRRTCPRTPARPTSSTAGSRRRSSSASSPPGTPLSELSLVERTGASRTPVREALRRLAAEGLVDLVPRQGARVSRVSLQSVRDLFDFRALLEPAAIRQATEAAAADPALRRVVRVDAHGVRPHPAARPDARPARGPSTSWPTGSTGRSSRATRNEHLRRTIAELRPHTARLRNLSHVDPQRVDVSVAEHLVICDALLRGDAEEAAARTADHLVGSLATIFRNLASTPGSGLDLARLSTGLYGHKGPSVGGLDRQDGAVGVEQDPLRLAAGDQLAGGRATAEADDDQARLQPVGRLDELLGRLVAADELLDLVDDAGLVQPGAHVVEGVLRTRSGGRRGCLRGRC